MPTFNPQPTLHGPRLTLRPLRASDWPPLYHAASDPLIWQLHPRHDRHTEPVFRQFFEAGLASGGALVAIDNATNTLIGTSRFARFSPLTDELEIGYTFLARSHWGTGGGGTFNAEMKHLMLTHAFQFVPRVIFAVAATNLRSRRALEKIGASLTPRTELITIHETPILHLIYQRTRL